MVTKGTNVSFIQKFLDSDLKIFFDLSQYNWIFANLLFLMIIYMTVAVLLQYLMVELLWRQRHLKINLNLVLFYVFALLVTTSRLGYYCAKFNMFKWLMPYEKCTVYPEICYEDQQ